MTGNGQLREPLLVVENLEAGYGDTQVLWGVTLDVLPGEMLAVVGANGAGKTTLLRTLSGLIVPTSGRIRFAGRDIAGARSPEIVRLGMGHVPEGRRLFSGMTVEENLRMGAYGRAHKDRAAVRADLERVYGYFARLRDRRRQIAGTLSGGEQQMCAIGRALMGDPRLLLIDELSLGLAPVVVEELIPILHDIQGAGTTIVLIEQDVSVALQISDRAFVIETGRVTLSGPARELAKDEAIVRSYLGE
ncbi:MAG: ABC transporter ATP-binding protein [Candidatus Rokubacteria bacterium]|nr:ABC transporter ATP-binding protein [Candidatus Rokubacteria bacterium]